MNDRMLMLLVAIICTVGSACAGTDIVWGDGEAKAISEDAAYDSLAVTVSTTVTIPEGVSLTVDDYVGAAALTKSGAGTLVIRNYSADSIITATEGTVRFASGGSTDTAALSGDAFYHVDASSASSIATSGTYEGNPCVSQWSDVRGKIGHPAAGKAYTFPLPSYRENYLNGNPVVDFGTAAYGAALLWSAGSDKVRDVIMVHTDTNVRNRPFLGASYESNKSHWIRGDTGAFFADTYSHANLRSGGIYADGIGYTYDQIVEKGFHVLRFAPAGGVHASCFGYHAQGGQGGAEMRGAQMLAEVVVFTNVQDTTLARRIEMRMQRKWLPTLQTLAGLTLQGAATVTVDAGETVTPRAFSCADGATVSGDGELRIATASDLSYYNYGGNKIVKAGAGKLTVRATPARRITVEAGSVEVLSGLTRMTAAHHFDADMPVSATFVCTSSSGTNFVYRWYDAHGQTGWTYPSFPYTSVSQLQQLPNIVSVGQNGRAILDFRAYYDGSKTIGAGGCGRLKFPTSGFPTKVRDAFLIVADTDSARKASTGNFLLGATADVGSSYQYNYHRGGSFGLLTTSYGAGKNAGTKTFIDGTNVAVSAPLPEGFHLVRISTTADQAVQALAWDRNLKYGGLKYGEIILYTGAKASDDEAAAVTEYLMNKWGLGDMKASAPTFGPLTVASGASLTLPEWTKISALDIPDADHLGMRVTSKVQLIDGMTLTVGPLAGVSGADCICLMEADEILGSPTHPIITLDSANEFKLRLYVKGNKLMAEVHRPGLVIIVR